MRTQGRTVEGELAGAHHGVVTRPQLLAAGVSPAAIGRRVRSGVLLIEHPGVYRLGHRAPSVEATYLAAVLACGDAALLCGRAAAHLFALLKGVAPCPEVVTATERRIAGIRTRRCRRLAIELDSYRFHGSRHAWEQDRRREREARARGDDFRRYTYGDVFEHPRLMLRELRELLRCPG